MNKKWGMQLLCKVLWVEYEGVESYTRVKLIRSTLRILCDLGEFGQDWEMVLEQLWNQCM